MTMRKIVNVRGTARHTCPCPSWLRHWERYSGQTTRYCQAIGCLRTDVVGAHVWLADVWDATVYIYPLCTAHNNHDGEMLVSAAFTFVPATGRYYCGS
jgi:hypothetical protein